MKRAGKEKEIIMKLYFGNTVTTVTTLMILALLGFIGYSVCSRAHIMFWGRRSAVLLVFGLAVCCFAAARDGLDKTIQHAIDGSCAPGLFPLVSVPTDFSPSYTVAPLSGRVASEPSSCSNTRRRGGLPRFTVWAMVSCPGEQPR